jgi:hypothetical protein
VKAEARERSTPEARDWLSTIATVASPIVSIVATTSMKVAMAHPSWPPLRGFILNRPRPRMR